MMSEWQEYILEDVVERFIDYRGQTPPKTDSGIPLVTAKIVKNGSIQAPNEFISKKTYDKWMTRGFPKKNDVVLTTEAPLGEVALLKDENVALAQRIILIRGNPNILNNGFLKYYFQSREGQHLLQSRASGTTVFGIKAAVLRKVPIPVPPIPEQKAITAVLASLDDKIDLLHRQNKTLESLAQTLFRHWFVDGTAVGWEECSLYDAIELVGGGTPKTSEESYWNGDVYWLSGGDIANNHKNFVVSTEKKITVAGLNNSSAKLLPQFATVISARGTVGKYCILSEQMTFSQSNYGIKPKFEGCFFFTYLLIDYSVTALQAAAYGSVFDTITTQTFKNHIIDIPTATEIQAFEAQVKPYFQRMHLNQKQIRTLEKLRDTLLPKLMSGEVRVRQN